MRKKFCPKCEKKLWIKCFGISKARKDGRNCYCKECALAKVHEFRQRIRAMKAAIRERKAVIETLERKPNVLSEAASESVLEKVRNAVEAGCATRDQIQANTKLDWDDLGVALAELTFERGVLRIERVGSKREFHLAELKVTDRAA